MDDEVGLWRWLDSQPGRQAKVRQIRTAVRNRYSRRNNRTHALQLLARDIRMFGYQGYLLWIMIDGEQGVQLTSKPLPPGVIGRRGTT